MANQIERNYGDRLAQDEELLTQVHGALEESLKRFTSAEQRLLEVLKLDAGS